MSEFVLEERAKQLQTPLEERPPQQELAQLKVVRQLFAQLFLAYVARETLVLLVRSSLVMLAAIEYSTRRWEGLSTATSSQAMVGTSKPVPQRWA